MANTAPSFNSHSTHATVDDGLTRSTQAQAQEDKQDQVSKSMCDCGSSLYDSFELYSFSQQLNHAMAGGSSSARIIEDGRFRSFSMPHYVSNRSGGTLEFINNPPAAIQEEEEEEVRDVLTHNCHSDFELQRPHPKSNNRLRMVIPRVVQRFFTGAFFLRSKANKHRGIIFMGNRSSTSGVHDL